MGGGSPTSPSSTKENKEKGYQDKEKGYVVHFRQDESKAPSSSSLQSTRIAAVNSQSRIAVGATQSARIAAGSSQSTMIATVAPKLKWLAKNLTASNLDPNKKYNPELNDFVMGRIIGKGLMGTVRLAKWKERKTYLAIKCIKKAYIYKHKDERHINNERKIMMDLDSSFCVKLFATFQDDTFIYFAMEFVPGGELFQRLTKVDCMVPGAAQFYVFETFSALKHLHSLGYVYRDLKPENIMIDADGHIKLVDFGFSTKPDAQGLMRTSVGTPVYLSPEQLNGKFTGGYTSSVDWWSLGKVFLEY